MVTKTKAVLAKEIVETIKSRNGRFLQRVPAIKDISSRRDSLVDGGQDDRLSHGNMRRRRRYAYKEVDDSVAIYKTKQTFRHQMNQLMIAEEKTQDNSTTGESRMLTEEKLTDDGTADPKQPGRKNPIISSALYMPPLPKTAMRAAVAFTTRVSGSSTSSVMASAKTCEIEDMEKTSNATSATNAAAHLGAVSQRRPKKRQKMLRDATGGPDPALLSRYPTTGHHDARDPILDGTAYNSVTPAHAWVTACGGTKAAAGVVPAAVNSEPRNTLSHQYSGIHSSSSLDDALTSLSSVTSSSAQRPMVNNLGATVLARQRHQGFLQGTEALILARQMLASSSTSYPLGYDSTMSQPPSFFVPAGARRRTEGQDSSLSDISHNKLLPAMLLHPCDLRARLVSLLLLQQHAPHRDGLASSSSWGDQDFNFL